MTKLIINFPKKREEKNTIIGLSLEVKDKSEKLVGLLIQKKEQQEAKERIKKIKEYIENILKPLAKENHVTLDQLLSWDTKISYWWYKMDFGIIANKKWLIKKVMKLSDNTFHPHGFLLTWADYKKHLKETPKKRYKIYISLDLSTETKKEKAEKFWLELIQKTKEKKLSLTTKTFLHNYDSCNLYTWHIKELTEILKELYVKYQKDWIFLDVYHFLQKPITWINPNHIWIVQEPIWWHKWWSHSYRMWLLGKYLDQWKTYEEACALIWIQPDAPRKIDE